MKGLHVRRVWKRSGALLLTILLILSLTAATLVSVIAVTLTSFQGRYVLVDAYRAWMLAESGEAFVHKWLRDNIDTPTAHPYFNGTRSDRPRLMMNEHDAIEVTYRYRIGQSRVITCVGIANYDQPNEIQREITFTITPPPLSNQMLPAGFDMDGDGQLDADTWALQGVTDPVIVTERDALALTIAQPEAALDLTWQSRPDLDLVAAWANNGQLLEYETQMKLGYFDDGVGVVDPLHYMVGFTFRQSPDDNNAYGLSFFQSRAVDGDGNPVDAPTWLPGSFNSLRGTAVHLVLWSRIAGAISLINHRPLTQAEGMTIAGDNGDVLNPFSTLLLEFHEQHGVSGRENSIRAYLATPAVYPDLQEFNDAAWAGDPSVFPAPVQWSDPVTSEIVDTLYTSEFFGQTPGQELSLHFFRGEDAGNVNVVIDDFAMRAEGYRDPNAAILQY